MKQFPLYRPSSFRVADWLTRHMPPSTVRVLARGLANFSYWCVPHLRRSVHENLRRVIPDNPKRVRVLARQTFRNYGSQLVDYSRATHLANGEIETMLARIDGMQHLDDALQRGRGAIIVTAHFGNWELGGLLFALKKFPFNAVTLEEHIDHLTEMREQYRAKRGIRTIRIGRSPFSFIDIMAALRRNEIVAMLVERPFPRSAVEVEFFGEPAPFSSGPVVLAMTTGAAILPAFVWCEPDGKYHGELLEPITLEMLEDRSETIRRNTQRIARVFETVIREHPDQWYNFVPIWKQH